jgi:hypothetical protein
LHARVHTLTRTTHHTARHTADSADQLASEFAAHVNTLSLKAPLQHRRPSPLDPPTATVAAQMDALQINDWPQPDAGVHTAVRALCACACACVCVCVCVCICMSVSLGGARQGAWRLLRARASRASC